MVLKLEHFGKYSRHTLKVLKCGAGEGRASAGTIVCKMKYYRESRKTGIFCVQ
jgi:hypothetical protein